MARRAGRISADSKLPVARAGIRRDINDPIDNGWRWENLNQMKIHSVQNKPVRRQLSRGLFSSQEISPSRTYLP
ncbi:hypothetical protein CPT34_25880 [Rhizobium sophoriradicis]|uniref:Uncharacterized protein n=1 Tax=Rhizobium sophoriradicis TaxID=1535245 RepID=A0A2A5KM76_9HYPH|nr:hypothetical protein CPT34_25880 [Rhizobium sophoriradicis]